MEHYPVIVIGGGTMGSAAAWALAKRGIPTLVLEQFHHVHTFGSHSGKVRIIRHAYAESPDYVPLVLRADSLWGQLEAETGRKVLYRTGGLDLAAPGFPQAARARQSALQHSLPHEWLDGAEVRRRWPAWTIDDDWETCYSPDTGFLLVEPALESLMAAAVSRGITLRDQEAVREWKIDGSGIVVRTDRETFTADRLIVTAGAWSGQVLAALGLPLKVLRKVVWWLRVEDPTPFAIGDFPIFIAQTDLGSVYGFPLFNSSGLRIANHSGGATTDPASVDRVARDAEVEEVLSFARRYLAGVTSKIVDRAVCLYTVTPDENFVIDRHPSHPQVVIGAGFSGHGFKFAPAVGELLAALALDQAASVLPRFSIGRF